MITDITTIELQDYFAAKILEGLLSRSPRIENIPGVAESARRCANAMIARRGGNGSLELRDYYAAKFARAIACNTPSGPTMETDIAQVAYEAADALLAETA